MDSVTSMVSMSGFSIVIIGRRAVAAESVGADVAAGTQKITDQINNINNISCFLCLLFLSIYYQEGCVK